MTPRRMKANPKHFTGRHSIEHDEGFGCNGKSFTASDGCEPVPAEPTIGVPATGTVLVIDGVVQDIDPGTVTVSRDVDRKVNAYYMETRPKPTFFEVGKRYRTKGFDGEYAYFTPKTIEENPGGRQVAFGLFEPPGGEGSFWETRHYLYRWEEVS